MQPAIFYTIVLLGLGLAAVEARPSNSATEERSITADTKVPKIGVHMDISEDMAVDKESTMEPSKPKSATISPSLKTRDQQEIAPTTTSQVKAKSSTIVPMLTIQQRIDEDATTVNNTIMEPLEATSSMTSPNPQLSSQSKATVETFKSSSASSSKQDLKPTTDMTPMGIEPRLSVTLLKILTRLG